MSILVLAEHDNVSIKAATLNTVSAAAIVATFLDKEVHILIAGYNAQGAADAATSIAGVSKVLLADAPQLADGLAENVEAIVLAVLKNYTYILAPATPYGKDIAPRIAAKLDVAQISDITAIDAADTFRRPVYAGNTIATVQSSDPIKVVTVRGTGFRPVVGEGGCASVERISWHASDVIEDDEISRILIDGDRHDQQGTGSDEIQFRRKFGCHRSS